MKFKLLSALMAFAATVTSAQQYTLVTSNQQATISYTNTYFTGVSTLQGKAGKIWVPLQNFFTTERIGRTNLAMPAAWTNYTEFRIRTLSVGPGIAFRNLAAAYGDIHTVAGSNAVPIGVNGWRPEFEGALATAVNLSNPRAAVATTNGDIYIVEKDRHAVSVIVKATGRLRTVLGTNGPGTSGFDLGFETSPTNSPLHSPSALWMNGRFLYVLDSGNRRVRAFDTLGNTVRTVFRDESGITNGSSLWISPDELEAYYTDGTMLKHWTTEPEIIPATFIELTSVGKNPSGQTVVADRGDNRILRVRDNGEKIPLAGSGFSKGLSSGGRRTSVSLPGASSLWFMPIGGYLVGLDQPDSDNGAGVWYVDADRLAAPLVYGKPGVHQGDGEWFRARGKRPKVGTVQNVTLAPSGDIIMVDGNQFIRTIDFLRHKP